MARFGSFVLTNGGPFEQTPAEVAVALVEALRADSRVRTVIEPTIEEQWCASGIIYPSPPKEPGIKTWHHHYHFARFNEPIRITVEVP